MSRLERLRKVIDDIVRQQPDEVESRCGFVHLYGVAATSAMLALKRGFDVELCTTAGMLHDIWAYKTGNSENHAELSALEAERILRESDEYTCEEISVIRSAIRSHSAKDRVDDEWCELLKDADVLQHHLYNPLLPVHEKHSERLKSLFSELNML